MFEIELPGKPIHMQRHRSFLKNGRIHFFNTQDNIKKNVKLICKKLLAKYPDFYTETGQVNIWFDFFFQRPKNHYRAGKFAHILKESAPVAHISTPDVDNLVKFYMDVLTGIAYKDDSQVG